MAEEAQVARALSQSLYGRAANHFGLRRLFATVSRKEDQQNGYYCGMLNRASRDRIGTGPKLRTFFDDDQWNAAIQRRWQEWARSVKLGSKLRTAVRDASRDGACLGVKFTRPDNLHPVKLDVRFVDSLRLRSESLTLDPSNSKHVDGIDLDDLGVPIRYWIANDDSLTSKPTSYEAKDVIHYFTSRSSEQFHGIPEAAAGLLLYPQLRRYVAAVIRAAESSASFVFWLKSNGLPPAEEALFPFEHVPYDPGTIQVLPNGYEMQSVTPTQPTANHWEFVKSLIAECARCFDMPLILAIGSAADANFSAANFDAIPYETSTKIHRQDIECDVVENLFRSWYEEAITVEGYFPIAMRQRVPDATAIPRAWGWDRTRQHADPLKEANAISVGLASGQRTLGDVYDEAGLDARAALEAEARLHGVSYEEFMKLLLARRFGLAEVAIEDDVDDDDDQPRRRAA